MPVLGYPKANDVWVLEWDTSGIAEWVRLEPSPACEVPENRDEAGVSDRPDGRSFIIMGGKTEKNKNLSDLWLCTLHE